MKRVAIVGSGIAGMACAWYLRNTHQVFLYEKNDYIGGHTNTVTVEESSGKRIPIDTGFMVYNEHTYPELLRFFAELGVDNALDTDMSFSVQVRRRGLEYACSNANTFFAQRKRVFSVQHWKLLATITRFFREAKSLLLTEVEPNYTVENFVTQRGYSQDFIDFFLLPMTGAIWSTPPGEMLKYPAQTLFRFMDNHGLLGIGTQFVWKTLRGGSWTYRDRVLQELSGRYVVNAGVTRVERVAEGVQVTDSRGETHSYDAVVLATHADNALALLAEPTDQERALLGAFQYNVNRAVLHSDRFVMPRNRRAWASWNYHASGENAAEGASTHYWMNSLQPLDTEQNYFVSIDYAGSLDPTKIHWQTTYTHPRFDAAAVRAQAHLPKLNASGKVLFCGSYFRYGFHEDALRSALDVVECVQNRFTGTCLFHNKQFD